MTGLETALLVSNLAGPLLSFLGGGGSDQVRQSFEGTDVDPRHILGQAYGTINRLGNALGERASRPITLRGATVQQPGAYTGGGLPMPFGLVASDPALTDPSILSRPGNDLFKNLFGESAQNPNAGFPDAPGYNTPPFGGPSEFDQPQFDQRTDQNPNGTTDGGEPTPDNHAEARSGDGPRRRINDGEYGQLVRASDLDTVGGGDDLGQAVGSVDLLLQALGYPSRL